MNYRVAIADPDGFGMAHAIRGSERLEPHRLGVTLRLPGALEALHIGEMPLVNWDGVRLEA